MTATDPRARQLAEAVHGLAREKATSLPAWGDLPLSEREKVTAEARLWLRAAVDAGLVPPTTDRATLRDRVAGALADALMPRYGGPQHNTPGGLPLTATAEEVALHRAQPLADAVLVVLSDDGRAALARVERLALTFEVSGNEFIAQQIRAAVTDVEEQPDGHPDAAPCKCGHSKASHMGDQHERGCYACWDSPGNQEWGHPFTPAGLRCVCGDPVQLMDDNDPTSWIHSPGSDTRCLDARPRCPLCQMPHDQTPSMKLVCASILASIRDAGQVADGAEQPAGSAGGVADRIVAYRAPVSNNLYCAPCGESDRSTPLTSDDLPDGGLCVGCGVDVLIPQEADRG